MQPRWDDRAGAAVAPPSSRLDAGPAHRLRDGRGDGSADRSGPQGCSGRETQKIIGSEPRYQTDVAWHSATAILAFNRCCYPPGATRQLMVVWGLVHSCCALRMH